MFNVYSLRDITCVMSHPSVGKCTISETGDGRIGFSFSGDMSQNTKTSNGYVTVNRIKVKDGQITLEVPCNADSDIFIKRWIKYLDSDKTSTAEYADATLTITDPFAKINADRNGTTLKSPKPGVRTYTFYGVVPQKQPDGQYEQTAQNVQYQFPFAEMVEK